MSSLLRKTASAVAVTATTMAAAGCGILTPSSPTPVPSEAADLSAIACATDNPADVGGLTGAWQGDDTGVYYIRQVGDCLWWFGTEIRDIQRGVTGQSGFANVAGGHVEGDEVVVEWADVPMGYILNGGGLTLAYDRQNDQLVITERRGNGQPFGATTFTRLQPESSPDASPTSSPSP